MDAWEKFFLLMFILWVALTMVGMVRQIDMDNMLIRLASVIVNGVAFMLSGKKGAR